MANYVQLSTYLPKVCLPSSHYTEVKPNRDPSPNSPIRFQLSGSDVANIIIAISVLIEVILNRSTKPKR